MAIKRYPHNAVLKWVTAGTMTTTGYWSDGTLSTLGIECDIQPQVNKYVVNEKGDRIKIDYKIFTPLITASIPTGARIEFFSTEMSLLGLFNFQTHSELTC